MPETHSIETFTFDELEGNAKEKARSWYQEGWSDLIVDGVSELFSTELSLRGLYLETAWEFYVQGGGVAFSGTIDLSGIKPVEGAGQEAECITAITTAIHGVSPDDLNVQVSHSHQHTSPSGMDVEVTCYAEDSKGDPFLTDEQIEELQEAIRDWLINLAHDFHRVGESEIEYMESDEQISESCEANEYLFDKYGKPVHHLIEGETA